jgi:hypothetical protein
MDMVFHLGGKTVARGGRGQKITEEQEPKWLSNEFLAEEKAKAKSALP